MKTIYLRMPDGKEELETGAVVTRAHLEEKGHRIVRNKTRDYDVVLCWGCSMQDPLVKRVPALNGKVNSFNKLQALEEFQDNGVLTPVVLMPHSKKKLGLNSGPWFGRNVSHAKGKDIAVFQTAREALEDEVKDFYTLYIPHERELRVWVFQGKAFAVYHKHYRNPGLDNYKKLECRSELLEDLLTVRRLTKPAVVAVEALKLDFGAVDILEGIDGRYYVLEVNSMPDISSMIRVSGIRLADLVSKWAEAQ